MAATLEDLPTEMLPRISAFRPPLVGPLVRALLAALAVAVVLGLTLHGVAAALAGAGAAMIFVGITLFRVIRSTDRGY